MKKSKIKKIIRKKIKQTKVKRATSKGQSIRKPKHKIRIVSKKKKWKRIRRYKTIRGNETLHQVRSDINNFVEELTNKPEISRYNKEAILRHRTNTHIELKVEVENKEDNIKYPIKLKSTTMKKANIENIFKQMKILMEEGELLTPSIFWQRLSEFRKATGFFFKNTEGIEPNSMVRIKAIRFKLYGSNYVME